MSDEIRAALYEGENAGSRYSLVSPARLPMGISGVRLGKGAGSSLEFLDHREYQPGDDIRQINWSVLARTDRLTIKLFREEITPHLDIFIDTSRSMALEGTEKLRAVLSLAGLLARAADNAGFTHCPWLIAGDCRRVENGHFQASGWGPMQFSFSGNCADSLLRFPPSWKPLGIRILLSDLLWDGDPEQIVRLISQNASAVLVVQILAKDDVQPMFKGNMRLYDVETESHIEMFVDDLLLQRYRESLAGLQQNWQAACTRAGVRMTTMIAERFVSGFDPVELIQSEFLSVI